MSRSIRPCILATILAAAAVSARGNAQEILQEAGQPGQQTASPMENTSSENTVPVGENTASMRTAPAQTLTLADAQRRALSDNPSMQSVAERVVQARMRVRQAWSAYLPQITAGYTAAHTELAEKTVENARAAAFMQGIAPLSALLAQPVTDPLAQLAQIGDTVVQANHARAAVPGDADNYEASLTATLLLFDGFAREYALAMAKWSVQEAEQGRREACRQLLNAVARAFHGVQLYRENAAIAAADEAYNTRLLKEAKARRRVGMGSLSDELNFEVRLRAATTQRLSAELDLRVAHIGLAALMGLPNAAWPEDAEVEPLPSECPEDMRPPEEETEIERALAQRPDILQSEYAVNRAGALVGQRRAAFLPSVSAFASQNAQRGDNSHFEEDGFSSTAGVSVSYDIFAGGRNRAALGEAKSAKRGAQWDRQNVELNAASEVREAVQNVVTAQRQLLLQRTTAEYVERNRDMAEKEYNAGQGSLAFLNQAQRDLIEAQSRLVLARVGLIQAWYGLRTATAETLQDFSGQPVE